MLLKTISAGAKVTFQTNYIGTFLMLHSITEDITVDAVKVVALGDGVLTDLDQNGVHMVGMSNLISTYLGKVNNNMRIIPLSDGLVSNKVTDITVDNTSGAGDVRVYMPVTGKGTTYIECIQQTILVASQSVFTDFSMLFGEGLGQPDQITVDFEDGASHTFDGDELKILSAYEQDMQQQQINNMDGVIKKVTIIPNSDKRVYLMRFSPISNL